MKQIFKGFVTNKKEGRKPLLHWLVKIVPPDILAAVMKWHYYRIVRSITEKQIEDLKIGRYFVDSNDYVIDVGSNVGVYTKILSKWVGNQGRVYSIEPIPTTFEILTHNINRLKLNNINSINSAISDVAGIVTMEIPKNDLGIENHYLAQVIKAPILPSSEVYHIKSCTLDELFSCNQHRVSFIKIDTEGHELPCIKGARETISRWKPVLLIEISSDLAKKRSEGYQLNEILKKYGYHPFCFNGVSVSKWHPGETSVNYFFFTSDHIDGLKRQNLYSIFNG